MSPPGIVALGYLCEAEAGGSEIQSKPGLWNAHLRNKIRAGEMAQWVECWGLSSSPAADGAQRHPSVTQNWGVGAGTRDCLGAPASQSSLFGKLQ